ncbi:nucleotidyltransferase domain-containing protein [Marinomonas sp. A79]|uniref:Nucleotidyltransferase domain-containing protein n=1 Tax=Marinomonas vulgaris TaxID=2823372 RepID=A0ABS5H781_9GAMM|nr:nucleotidyltransferase domain-containing protein [Marinomonas vulgaris]MBR7887558.1 nucleotidyltransferase domain-containing protein [Marinomonas vulgaris]
MSQSLTLALLEKLAKEQPEIKVVWLYGSRAKGNAEEDSDYDLAVAYDFTALKKHDYPNDELAYHWSQKTSQKISVVDINQVPTALAYSVINDGNVIYCRESLRLHSEQSRVWALWEAFRYEHKRHRQPL